MPIFKSARADIKSAPLVFAQAKVQKLKLLCGHKKRAADLRRPADSTLKIKVIKTSRLSEGKRKLAFSLPSVREVGQMANFNVYFFSWSLRSKFTKN